MIALVSKEINQLKKRKENNGSVCSGSYYYNNNCYYNRGLLNGINNGS
jgi:hypothetical protein